jgi:hypothetical protein
VSHFDSQIFALVAAASNVTFIIGLLTGLCISLVSPRRIRDGSNTGRGC